MSLRDPAEIADQDAADRISDMVNLHITVDREYATGRWVACALADGRSDGVLYDTKQDAVDHQLHQDLCLYVCVPPDGMTSRHALTFLRFNRQLVRAGYRMSDPGDVRPNIGR